MGKTSLQIVNEFLIKEAMALLADTDTTIAYMADNLGSAESQSLYHFFKRNTGYTQPNTAISCWENSKSRVHYLSFIMRLI
ncbi:hypothetical protein [Sphingobacterium thalpophilum]|uniref:hypothetical protein n=1 Tax=Sphingobacterium thalpophilum TaxID=259 RepID=UPI0024A66BC2|nr:hypothetical protein [Sphingobacterium thalpophilum]